MMASSAIFVWLPLVLVVSLVTGNQSVTWCVCPSTMHIAQNSTCQSLSGVSSRLVSWQAMRGELENKQILVETRDWDPNANLSASVSLTFSDLVSGESARRIGSKNLNWWQVGYVYCRTTPNYSDSGGGWRPDPLLPPSDNRVFLEVEVTQPLWIQVSVPRNASRGLYLGTITMKLMATHSVIEVITIPVQLTVWDITVPELKDAKFPAVFSFTPDELYGVYGSRVGSVVWDYIDLFVEQRIAGNHLYASSPEYVQYTQYYAKQGVQWLTMMTIGKNCKVNDSSLQELLKKVQDAVDEFEQLGILDNMFLYGYDESDESCLPTIQKVWSAVKANWTNVRTMSTLNWAPPKTVPLDAWVKSYHIYNETEADQWLLTGHQQWWYHCLAPQPPEYMNTFIERPLMETRLLFWLAGQHDVAGWLYYNVANFEKNKAIEKLDGTARTDYDPATYPNSGASFWNGDGNFVYPGRYGPVPSTRLHNLRDGFEDAELFRMLSLEECAPLLNPLVRGPTDFTLNPVLMEQQRVVIAQLVESKKQIK